MLKLIVACGAVCFIVYTAPQKAETEKRSEHMACSEMEHFPGPRITEGAKVPRWEYTHGLVIKSMLGEWKHIGDSAYYEYTKIYIDGLIGMDDHVKTMRYLSFDIDSVNDDKILFDPYVQSGDKRYRIAIDTLHKQATGQPCTGKGEFWHRLRHPHQMWPDGIFMASPYLVQYDSTFQESALYSETVKQILLIARKIYGLTTGLYYRGWDESREQKRVNPETGCSPNSWSHSIGWYGAALVSVLGYLSQEAAGRDSVAQILQRLMKILVKYQDPQPDT